MTFTKDKKIIHNFVNFQTSQKVMFVYPFPASRANKELILYPDNKKIKHAWSNPEQNIWISQWYQRPKKHTQKPMYINLFQPIYSTIVTTQEYLHILMLQNHPFPTNQSNQLLANCNKTTKRNTKETSFFSWTKPVKTDRQPKPYGQVQIQGREIVNIVNIHTSN